jgi:hypothetical protein
MQIVEQRTAPGEIEFAVIVWLYFGQVSKPSHGQIE